MNQLTFLPRMSSHGKDSYQMYGVFDINKNIATVCRETIFGPGRVKLGTYKIVPERFYSDTYRQQIENFVMPLNLALRMRGEV